MRRLALLLAVAACGHHAPAPHEGSAVASATPAPDAAPAAPDYRDPREVHLGPLTQLSMGGENAEAYWSNDGTQLIFQTTRDPYQCDQIMRMPADGSADPVLVSTGKGRTTCSYFLPGDQEVIFSSTHEVSPDCPPPADRSKGYTWALYDYDVYRANVDGSNLHKITDSPGYDAESTVCPKDGSIIFTSIRDGDLDLYRMDADGKNVKRLTNTPGYDGGAYFDADCTHIVWRASRPTGKDLDDYRELLKQKLVRPTQLEIMVANADGTDAHQVTYLHAASFGPYFFPSGKRIIFASNYGDPQGREFDLWAINVDGSQLERITYTGGFDGFPMFSPDGSKLAFASNRHGLKEGETDLFVAPWNDTPPKVDTPSPADRFMDDVAYLASDDLGGRLTGSDGAAKAADYIEKQMKAAGVEVTRQPFDVTTGVENQGSTLTVDGAAIDAAAFTPLSLSSNLTATGKTVYVGYGISDKKLEDDYKGKDVKGKVVVVRRFTPEGKRWTDEVKTRQSDLHTKAITARLHGAVGMIVVDVPAKGDEAPLPALDTADVDSGIAAAAITRAAGDLLTKGSHDVAMTIGLSRVTATAENVIGVLRAPGKADGALVIGAHYDHLGMGGPNALDTVHAVHNGADDNASGVAALLEVARALAADPSGLTRDVYFVAFSGEEEGDLGSTYFVAHPPMTEPIVAMLNMDMVGRMRDDSVQAQGADTADEWKAMIAPICATVGVSCAASGDGYGPSDHMPFYIAKIPVLFFFTGSHLDYHTATDDADKINAGGGAAVAAIVTAVARQVAGGAKLTYRAAKPHVTGGDQRIRGASLGTIPAYADDGSGKPGMLISDVVPGGPAEKAGLKGGDRLLDIGGVKVSNVYDLMYVLEAHKPGDKAKLTYERGGAKKTVEITFAAPHARK